MSEEMIPPTDAGLPEDLRALERALGALTPARAGGLDRDRVMYEAGRAAAMRAGRVRVVAWQGACGFLAVACAGLMALRGAASRDAGQTAGRVPPAPVQVAIPAVPEKAPGRGRATWAAWLMPGGGGAGAAPMMGGAEAAISEIGKTGGAFNGGSGGRYLPTLKRSEGLDALPGWQLQAVVFGGNRS